MPLLEQQQTQHETDRLQGIKISLQIYLKKDSCGKQQIQHVNLT